MHRDTSKWSTMALQYNEYIVFDQDRIRIKFIVHCERGSSSSFVAPTIQAPIPQSTTAVPRITIKPNIVPMIQSSTVHKPIASAFITSTARAPSATASTFISSGLMNSQRNNGPSIKPTTTTAPAVATSGIFSTVHSASSNSSGTVKFPKPKPLASVASSYNTGVTGSNSYSAPSSTRFSTIGSGNSGWTNQSSNAPLFTESGRSSSLRTTSYPNHSTLRNPTSSYPSTRNESDEICSCCVILWWINRWCIESCRIHYLNSNVNFHVFNGQVHGSP